MNDLGDLYQEIILDHYKKPRNAGRLEQPTCSAAGDNPLCGDKISITVKKTGDRIEDIRWNGAGCAISTASASLMSDAVKGKTLREFEGLFDRFHAMVTATGGCAGGTARPAVAMALQNKVIPDHLTAAFAGMERDAVNKVREYHAAAAPPSSPSIVIFKDGKVAEMFGRERIEQRSAPEVAADLVEAFNKHCTKAGPSIPAEQFAKLTNVQA